MHYTPRADPGRWWGRRGRQNFVEEGGEQPGMQRGWAKSSGSSWCVTAQICRFHTGLVEASTKLHLGHSSKAEHSSQTDCMIWGAWAEGLGCSSVKSKITEAARSRINLVGLTLVQLNKIKRGCFISTWGERIVWAKRQRWHGMQLEVSVPQVSDVWGIINEWEGVRNNL